MCLLATVSGMTLNYNSVVALNKTTGAPMIRLWNMLQQYLHWQLEQHLNNINHLNIAKKYIEKYA